MAHVRLSHIAAGAVAGLGLVLAVPATAAVGQPAIPHATGPFRIGPSDSPGTVALTPSGGRVAVFDIRSGNGKTRVCLISATGRSCFHSTLLTPPASSDSTFGTPGVFVPSANHVVVLQNTCCDTNPDSTVLYTSTDGGRTFSAPVRVGSLGVDASELIGGQVLFTQQDNSAGVQVVSVPVSAAGASPTATLSGLAAFDVGLGQYKGGALLGTDHLAKSYTSYVYYAPKGKSFDLASSYHKVGTFSGESVLGMSGSALLTERSKAVLLRMFNGTRFAAARTVAHVHGGLGTWFTVEQDPSGHVHVFAIMQTALYELREVSTSNGGKTWTAAAKLGNGINSIYLSAAVNSKGKGMVLGNTPAWGYPVP